MNYSYKNAKAKYEGLLKMNIELKHIPQHLYKYRRLNDHTEKIITCNEMYFSSPNDFNDPFDCKIPMDTKNVSVSEIKDYLVKAGVKQQELEKLTNAFKDDPNKFLVLLREKTENTINSMGICCFSSNDDNILMWSHYADYHRGICLKFDIKEDIPFFTIPVTVNYRHLLPHYNPYQREDTVEHVIRPKYAEWAYESEIRIVKVVQWIRDNDNERVFKFKDTALKEIIFGTKTTNDDIIKYKKLCCGSGKPDVQFSQMKLDTDSTCYKLKRVVV